VSDQADFHDRARRLGTSSAAAGSYVMARPRQSETLVIYVVLAFVAVTVAVLALSLYGS